MVSVPLDSRMKVWLPAFYRPVEVGMSVMKRYQSDRTGLNCIVLVVVVVFVVMIDIYKM